MVAGIVALFAASLVSPVRARAQSDGYRFRTEAVHADLSSVDPVTGYVTEVTVYAADDQGYKESGSAGAPERISKLFVTISQYDPSCVGGGGGPKVAAEAEPGGGDPDCYGRDLEGSFPPKDSTDSLPEDAFVVSSHQLDGAWLTTTLTLIDDIEDDPSQHIQAAIALTWTATGGISPIRANWLDHTPPETSTGHVNARTRDAVASGTIAFEGVSYDLTSSFASIADFQQIST